jgi:hypothetical protein
MISSREPSRLVIKRLLRSAVNCPSSMNSLNCRLYSSKDLSVSFILGTDVLSRCSGKDHGLPRRLFGFRPFHLVVPG